MRFTATTILSVAALLAGCGKPAEQQSAREQQPTHARASTPATNEQAPLTQNSLEEGPIDPKSVEAAGQIVQRYGALIEQGHWAEANALWGDAATAARFEASMSQYPKLHLEIGNPGEPEGAAGSVYVTIPAIFYGDRKDGQPFRTSADVILRRVNDVPGSTDAQRRWHIERIDAAT
jgi:hypothetical protein